jgi:phosphate transport system substrate-binding protein
VKLRRFSRTAAVLAAGALVLTACGGSDSGSDASNASSEGGVSGDLVGAGSSAQAAAMQAWQAGFQEANPDVTVSYDPVGSGGGREQFLDGATLFAGSDAYLDDEELAASKERCAGTSGAVDLPHYISPIAVAFNLEGVDTLNLTPANIAKIFDGTITSWDDPALKTDNPDVELPAEDITPVHRSDESGTTENFVDYLAQAAPQDWPYEVSGDWPAKGGEAAQGTSGVVQAVTAGNGAIGYADASQVGDLGVAAVKVGEQFVEYSPEAAAKVVEVSEPAEGRPQGDLAIDVARTTTEAGVYPIVLVSYHVVCLEYDSQEEADLVKAFMTYVGSEEGQQSAAQNAGSAPISATLRQQTQATIDQIKAAA